MNINTKHDVIVNNHNNNHSIVSNCSKTDNMQNQLVLVLKHRSTKYKI